MVQSLAACQAEMDEVKAKKANMMHPSRIPTLPPLNQALKLEQLGLDVSQMSKEDQHTLYQTITHLDKIRSKKLVTRTDLTALRI